jgi:hypothetical protein
MCSFDISFVPKQGISRQTVEAEQRLKLGRSNNSG